MLSVNSQIFTFPSWVITLVLGMGILLAVIRPLWGFLFSIAIPISFGIPTLVFTRYASVGAYFNLFDACMVVTLLAFFLKRVGTKEKVHVPGSAVAMLVVLGIGIMTTTARYGISYESLRALRWAINTPIYFIVSAYMIKDSKEIQLLLRTTFVGALIAETQHLLFVLRSPALSLGEDFGQIRSSMFQTARSESWLITGPYFDQGRLVRPMVQVLAAMLFGAALISTQTRTLAIGVVGGIVLYRVLFSSSGSKKVQKRYALSIVIILLFVFLVLPFFHLEGVTQQFARRFTSLTETGGPVTEDLSREIAFTKETNDWMTGGPLVLIFGNGLDYFSHLYGAGKEDVRTGAAWGHLGYVTYLSQLGLLGFFVYALFFPLTILKQARLVFKAATDVPEIQYLAGLTGAVFLYCGLAFITSGSFLTTDILPGVYAGAVASLYGRFTARSARSPRTCPSGWREHQVHL